ncbi:hypothetical protein AB1Y20_023600 [Prymnesium parvum]|uniref:PX domain-containing protein n=1 Tax=Prymnesium parvum TaxID=97485 RepID=A0AB34JF76_PRYPA
MAALLDARIVDTRKEFEKDALFTAVHGMSNSYLLFAIEIRHAGRAWVVWRRYKQFEHVRKALAARCVAARAPLPAKGVGLHVTSKPAAAERRAALEAWLRPVLLEGAALAHPAFLEFIGFPGPDAEGKSLAADGEAQAASPRPSEAEHQSAAGGPPAVAPASAPPREEGGLRAAGEESSLHRWLEAIKPGYGSRFSAAFEAVGIEDECDFRDVDDELMAAIEAELRSKGAKLLQLQRLRRALCAAGAPLAEHAKPTPDGAAAAASCDDPSRPTSTTGTLLPPHLGAVSPPPPPPPPPLPQQPSTPLRKSVSAPSNGSPGVPVDAMTELKQRLASGEPLLRPTAGSPAAADAPATGEADPMAELLRKLKDGTARASLRRSPGSCEFVGSTPDSTASTPPEGTPPKSPSAARESAAESFSLHTPASSACGARGGSSEGGVESDRGGDVASHVADRSSLGEGPEASPTEPSQTPRSNEVVYSNDEDFY